MYSVSVVGEDANKQDPGRLEKSRYTMLKEIQ